MRRWFGPLAFAALIALLSGYAALSAAPFALMRVAMDRLAGGGGGVNAMSHGNLATAERQPVVRPSPDLAYSSCPYDVASGPVEVRVVPVAGRYSSLSIFDAATDVAFVRNDIQAGGAPYRIVIAREGQAVPAGAEVVRVRHDRGIALIRLLLKDPAEITALDAVRRQSSCAPIGSAK